MLSGQGSGLRYLASDNLILICFKLQENCLYSQLLFAGQNSSRQPGWEQTMHRLAQQKPPEKQKIVDWGVFAGDIQSTLTGK